MKIDKKILEILGDYSMVSSRRMEAPGNIRSGQFVKAFRGDVLSDESLQNDDEIPKVACVLVRNAEGKILAVSRGKDLIDMNLPGGHVESGESVEDAALRELWEETGVIAHDLSFFYKGMCGLTLTYVFLAKIISDKIRSSEEGQARWVDESELLNGTFGGFYQKMMQKKAL